MKNRYVTSLLVAALLVAALLVRIELIQRSMPYPAHIDEGHLAVPAARILTTGDWNPHSFHYPTVPIYLVTGAFAVGFLKACATSPMHSIDQIGTVSYPFYTHRKIVRPARVLFALLSVLALACLAIVAVNIGDGTVAVLGVAVSSLSATYLAHSWLYLNVDIVGSFFALATIAFVLHKWESEHLWAKVLLPGVLCALTIGSKYNLYPVLLPCALAIVLVVPGGKRIAFLAGLLGVTVGAFVAFIPYSVLDFRTFLDDLGGAVHHYSHGHAGFTVDAGVEHASAYLRDFSVDYGSFATALAAVGAVALLWRDWQRGIVVLSFPVSLLTYMSLQRVHFPRNVLSLYLLVALTIAVGIHAIVAMASAGMARKDSLRSRHGLRVALSWGLVLSLFASTVPWSRVAKTYHPPEDSRRIAVRWIKENLPPGATLIVPQELSMNVNDLRSGYSVRELAFRGIDPRTVDGGKDAYWLIPAFGADPRSKLPLGDGDLNQAFGAAFRTLQQFGAQPILLRYTQPVPWGDPQFRIARIEIASIPSS